jgi:hypothetical protein
MTGNCKCTATRFDGRASIRTWLYQIATHRSLNQLPSARRRPKPAGRRHHRSRPPSGRCWPGSPTPTKRITSAPVRPHELGVATLPADGWPVSGLDLVGELDNLAEALGRTTPTTESALSCSTQASQVPRSPSPAAPAISAGGSHWPRPASQCDRGTSHIMMRGKRGSGLPT